MSCHHCPADTLPNNKYCYNCGTRVLTFNELEEIQTNILDKKLVQNDVCLDDKNIYNYLTGIYKYSSLSSPDGKIYFNLKTGNDCEDFERYNNDPELYNYQRTKNDKIYCSSYLNLPVLQHYKEINGEFVRTDGQRTISYSLEDMTENAIFYENNCIMDQIKDTSGSNNPNRAFIISDLHKGIYDLLGSRKIYVFPSCDLFSDGSISFNAGYNYVLEEFVGSKFPTFVRMIWNWKALFNFNDKNHMSIMDPKAELHFIEGYKADLLTQTRNELNKI